MVSIGTLLLGALAGFGFSRITKALERRDKLTDRVTELEKQSALMDHTVTPLSVAFQKMLVDQLTHYHTPEMDALMVKLTDLTLTAEEKARLLVMLEERTRDMGDLITPSERNAAAMLPMVMQRVEEEAELLKEKTPTLAVVAIPPPAEPKAPPEAPKEEDVP